MVELAGARWGSGMFLSSQNMWRVGRPVPYVSLVLLART